MPDTHIHTQHAALSKQSFRRILASLVFHSTDLLEFVGLGVCKVEKRRGNVCCEPSASAVQGKTSAGRK
eukprot:6129818-Amphidinium_carterae.1